MDRVARGLAILVTALDPALRRGDGWPAIYHKFPTEAEFGGEAEFFDAEDCRGADDRGGKVVSRTMPLRSRVLPSAAAKLASASL